jgi:hypothetical protein
MLFYAIPRLCDAVEAIARQPGVKPDDDPFG